MEQFLPLYIIVPLATALLICISGVFFKVVKYILPVISLLFLSIMSFYLLCCPGIKTLTYIVGGWQPVGGVPIGIHLELDPLSMIVLTLIQFIAFLVLVYSISYMKKYTARSNFYALFCLMVTGMNGVVITGDIFNLFVFLEISVISAYALVAFGTGKRELEASFKYQVQGGLASLLILFGIALLYHHAKTLNIADISKILAQSPSNKIVVLIQILFLTGFGLKSALSPFHAWLPDAHSSAPSPVSAMLSGVLIKAVGAYSILRLFFAMFAPAYEIGIILTTLAVISMVAGALLAIGQNDMKRVFAYSSISQMGFVFLALGIGLMVYTSGGDKMVASLSLGAGLYHLLNHAVMKGLLFLNAGAVEYSTGTRNIEELGGLSRTMPVTAGTELGASLSISGIPPFNGFFSKLFIVMAAIKAQYFGLAGIAIVISIVTMAYYFRVHKFVFWGPVCKMINTSKEVPFFMCFSMLVLCCMCLLMSFLVFPGIWEALLQPVVNVLIGI